MFLNNLKTLKHVTKELFYILDKKAKQRYIFVFIVMVISSALELIGVSAILPFIQAIIAPDKMMEIPVVKRAMNCLGIETASGLLIAIGVGLIIIYLVKNGFVLFANFVQYDYSTKVQKNLSIEMLNAYMSRPYTFFIETNSSEILRGCIEDISSVYDILSFLTTILAETLTIIMIAIFLVYTDPVIALGALLLMLLITLGIVVFFRPAMKAAGEKNMQATTLKNKSVYQAVGGIKEIMVMHRIDYFRGKYAEAAEISRKALRCYSFMNSSPDRIIEGICVSGLIGIVCVRLTMQADMMTFVPKIAAFAMAAFKILPSVGKIANRLTCLIYHRPRLASVYQNRKAANEYKEELEQNAMSTEQTINITFEKVVSVKNVWWKYKNQKDPVLTDASVTIEKGQAVAFVGASGSGKTTLSDIILGLLHPAQGTVEMDGIDVYSIPEIWAKIVGYVPQAVFLTDDTIRNNIAFGIDEREVNDALIWDALDRAQLRQFVERLPDGLDTIVGERGIKFSGGQKQRIAIARALYHKPEILVLDEATAALDNETESAVMKAIEALHGQITLIIVAHRLTTIRKCDVIYEVCNGKVDKLDKEEFWKKHEADTK